MRNIMNSSNTCDKDTLDDTIENEDLSEHQVSFEMELEESEKITNVDTNETHKVNIHSLGVLLYLLYFFRMSVEYLFYDSMQKIFSLQRKQDKYTDSNLSARLMKNKIAFLRQRLKERRKEVRSLKQKAKSMIL